MTKVAKTLEAVAAGRGRLLSRVLNRGQPLTAETINRLIGQVQFGMVGRRPLKAIRKDGTQRNTDFDLFSFLMAMLRKRQPIVTLPSYQNVLPRTSREDERHLTTNERHGKLVGLVAHEELLSLSVLIKDNTVARLSPAGEDTAGLYRTFMVIGYDGTWHRGFSELRWKLTEEEQHFFAHLKLDQGSSRALSSYLHLGRRESIFGAPYLRLKLLLERIDDELRFLRSEIAVLEEHGLLTAYDAKSTLVEEIGSSTQKAVPRFLVRLVGPKLHSTYVPIKKNEDGALQAWEQLSLLRQKRQLVQFVIRAAEVAFYHHGRERHYTAPWVKDVDWEVTNHSDEEHGVIKLAPGLTLSYHLDTIMQKVAAR